MKHTSIIKKVCTNTDDGGQAMGEESWYAQMRHAHRREKQQYRL